MKNLLTSVLILTSSFSSSGQLGRPDASQDETYWILGGKIEYADTAYRGVDGQLAILPYLAYKTPRAHFGFDKITYRLTHWGHEGELSGSLSAILSPRAGRPDPNDDNALGLADRDFSLDAGLRAQLNYEDYYLRATALADASGKYKGFSGSIQVGQFITFPEYGRLDLSLGAFYFDDNLSDYLYGVTASQATPGVGVYNPSASWKLRIGARFMRQLNERTMLILGASIDLLDHEARNSTLLEDDYESKIYTSIGWRF